MRAEKHQHRRRRRHGQHDGIGHPEHLAVQDRIPDRAAAHRRQASDEDEAHDVQL